MVGLGYWFYKKGKGFQSPEASAEKFHAVGKFCLETRIQKKNTTSKPTYTQIFAKILNEIAESDEKIVAIEASKKRGGISKKLEDGG